ncbi:hypothetical protein CEUSTIGMA_g7330.t1 [Chlamydomonas eustigma]|uniref:Thioesterase domain-containing protein n=1 Tax=Chlamydomonas eustigma TaxID=1157962 RepID=A0A250XAV4_9CHLO|nr:hypothetical protein CEUSTIGMA_g7330.t1 [Chlamydomonas eustigma]|eukprot:GAX79890.1 hypothetical protein CEUSTIGMA_g7330.t1 [Chlamydomonas eustigma]
MFALAVKQLNQTCLILRNPSYYHSVFHKFSNNERSQESTHATWQYLASRGTRLNPCNSPLHPAVDAGLPLDPAINELSVQEAYTPGSMCFGCGPAHPDGLHLSSKRIKNGLEAHLSIPSKYCAFPGIVNGGIVSTIIDCHGNWSAAIALMDKSCLPKPPLTLTASIFVSFKEPTPPDTPLLVRSTIISIKDSTQPGVSKPSVEVDIAVYAKSSDGPDKLLAHGTVMCKRQGALRAI